MVPQDVMDLMAETHHIPPYTQEERDKVLLPESLENQEEICILEEEVAGIMMEAVEVAGVVRRNWQQMEQAAVPFLEEAQAVVMEVAAVALLILGPHRAVALKALSSSATPAPKGGTYYETRTD